MAYDMREPSEFKVWLQINLIHKAMPYKTDQRQSHRSVKTKWSANKVETTGETTLDHRLSCTENGKSYW